MAAWFLSSKSEPTIEKNLEYRIILPRATIREGWCLESPITGFYCKHTIVTADKRDGRRLHVVEPIEVSFQQKKK